MTKLDLLYTEQGESPWLQNISFLRRERATRIELAFSAWEADVLPLNYARVVGDKVAKVLVSGGATAIDVDGVDRRHPGVTFT